MERQQVGVIGYGRFGRLWQSVLAPHHDVLVTDRMPLASDRYRPLPELCATCEALFLCVPINQIESAVREIRPHLRAGAMVADVCSVKVHPARALVQALGDADGVTLIATHPMFGPDSAANGVTGLPMVVWHLQGDAATYHAWTGFFGELGIRTVEMSPDEHDHLAAYSQGLTHYVGRVLRELDLQPTPIDTQGFRILRSLIEQTCNDSWELFQDLQRYNPYTREMRQRLEAALKKVSEVLERGGSSQPTEPLDR